MRLANLINILPKPSVIIVAGRRGSGKDVTAHRIAQICHDSHKVYVNFNPKKYGLPKYFEQQKQGEFKNKSVYMLTDAHLEAYARDWHSDVNKVLDKINTISRHKDIYFIYTTQQLRRLDVNVVSGVDCLIMKEPSFMADKFERPQLQDFIEEAREHFKGKSTMWKWRHAVAFTHTGNYYIENIKKPYYWSEDLSKLYGKEEITEPRTVIRLEPS